LEVSLFVLTFIKFPSIISSRPFMCSCVWVTMSNIVRHISPSTCYSASAHHSRASALPQVVTYQTSLQTHYYHQEASFPRCREFNFPPGTLRVFFSGNVSGLVPGYAVGAGLSTLGRFWTWCSYSFSLVFLCASCPWWARGLSMDHSPKDFRPS